MTPLPTFGAAGAAAALAVVSLSAATFVDRGATPPGANPADIQAGTPAETPAKKPAATAEVTPAEREIERAERGVRDEPKNPEAHIILAIALSKRARETADPAWYDRSDKALDASLKLLPDNFAALRQQVWNQLGRHEFAAALVGAKALNARAKDDVLTYGLLVDANVELGNYAEAEEAAQWMLNLRPGAPAALTRVSYLREQFGDIAGAIKVMDMAFHSTRPSDREDRAWILTHLAHLESERGHPERAVTYAENALLLFPEYHYALAELARARMDSGDSAEARALLERRYAVAGHPENLYALAVCTAACGDAEAAAPMFASFEKDALGESENVDNANLQLAEYWLEHSKDEAAPARALALVTKRAEGRRDVATLAGLAWAQHSNGQDTEAWKTMGEALAVGTRNPKIRYRAGVIAAAAGDPEAARTQWELTMQDAPRSKEGRRALKALMDLEEGSR